MAYLERNQSSRLEQLLTFFPAVLILGVRQCGKSTLSRHTRQDWSYFDLENSKDYDFISADIDFFLKHNSSQLILDEAQELPRIFKNLRGVIDQSSEKNRFILTGSSSPELVSLASDSLAGRIGIIELGTLKMNEIERKPLPSFYEIFEENLSATSKDQLLSISKKQKIESVLEHVLRGGYPEVNLRSDSDFFNAWMESYFQTYVNRDIRKLFPKLDVLKYRRFVSMLAQLSGTILNKAQLGRSIDVNEVTIRDYLEIAHQTFFWRLIPSFEKSQVKSVTKMPKGIFRDTGILHYLTNIDSEEKLLRSPQFGQNFESFVIEEIIKGVSATNVTRWDYYYYRTKNGVEVDLVLDGKFGTLPIEIKSGSSTTKNDVRSLSHFLKQEDLPVGLVINNADEIKMITEDIVQVPAGFI